MLCVDLEKAARDLHFTAVRFIDGDEHKAIYGPLFETEEEAQAWCDDWNTSLGYTHTANKYQVAQLVHANSFATA